MQVEITGALVLVHQGVRRVKTARRTERKKKHLRGSLAKKIDRIPALPARIRDQDTSSTFTIGKKSKDNSIFMPTAILASHIAFVVFCKNLACPTVTSAPTFPTVPAARAAQVR